MRGLSWKLAISILGVLVILLPLLVHFSVYSYEPIVIEPFGEVNVRLYVIALDGVGGHRVGNMTRMIEGILDASRVNSTTQYVPGSSPTTYAELKINTNVTVVRDWDQYKEIVESCSKAIIVNAHGETIPVPSNYSKEEWVDKIADAMANRNVTWVHTTSYPFYYYYNEGSSEGDWGEEGFQRLMSHIGKSNVTCNPSLSETEKIELHEDAEYGGLMYGWHSILDAFSVERGKPLNASNFRDCRVAIIWGTENDYMTGAVTKFAEASNIYSFGFYVHIGTGKTFTSGGHETDGDYYRGYVGAGAAIWACVMRFASEDVVSKAEKAIANAEFEGRTKDLDNARKLLQEARDENRTPWVAGSLQKAREAIDVADHATKPSIAETLALPLVAFSIVVIITGTGLAVRRKNNSKKGIQ